MTVGSWAACLAATSAARTATTTAGSSVGSRAVQTGQRWVACLAATSAAWMDDRSAELLACSMAECLAAMTAACSVCRLAG
jgi:ABC-type phosphonate transport system ATPase subunit